MRDRVRKPAVRGRGAEAADLGLPAGPRLWPCRTTIVLGWAMILCGFGLFVRDCLLWLRDGAWHSWMLTDVWGQSPLGGDGVPAGWAEMRGIHLILHAVLHWCGRFPIDLTLVALGLVVAWRSNDANDRAEREIARHDPRWRARRRRPR